MSDSEFTAIVEKELIPHLNKSKQLVIIGDFNLDVFGKQKKLVKNLCEKFACKMLINEPTTDNLSTLDLVFSNIDGVAQTAETYWSDHKIVFFHT